MTRKTTQDFGIPSLRENEQTQKSVLDVNSDHWSDIFTSSEYLIPEYQRNYSWEKNHQLDFLDTIFGSFENVEKLPDEDEYELNSPAGAYMGTLYFAEKDNKSDAHETTYEIVDGQQRLATMQIILAALSDYINHYHTGNGDCDSSTLEHLSTVSSHLSKAYDDDGNPSVKLWSDENDYFEALTAKPDVGRRTPARVRFIERRLEDDEHISGQHKPRAIPILDLIELFDNYSKYKARDGAFEEVLISELDESKENDSEESDEEDDEVEFSKRDELIRYSKSHERLVGMYKRTHSRIEKETSDLSNDETALYLANLSEFVLNGLTVNTCIITDSDSDLHMDIFESINDKGLDLDEIDKIRARIRHSLAGDDAEATISEWNNTLKMFGGNKDNMTEMLKYYVGVEGGDEDAKSTDALMTYFSRRESHPTVEPILNGGTDEIQQNLDDVLEYANYYYSMVDGDEDRLEALNSSISTECKQDIRSILRRLEGQIGVEQYRSLGAYACWQVGEHPHLDEDVAGDFLKEVFNAIEALSLRQSISDKSGQVIEGVYIDTARKLSSQLEEVDEVERAFDGKMIVNYLRKAAQEEEASLFENGMVRIAVTNTNWGNQLVRALYHRLTEQHLRDRDVELDLRNVGELDIEHIFPQTPISDNNNRSKREDDISKHAWLTRFFKTEEDDTKITSAVQDLIDHDVDSLNEEEIEELDLDDAREESDLKSTVSQIESRFTNDIGNLIFLHKSDDRSIQNKLFSVKLPAYVNDDYLQLPTNKFVGEEGESFNLFDKISGVELDDISDEEVGSIEDEVWEEIDKAWNYERMFERKKTLIPLILDSLTFSTKEDEFDLETIEDTIKEELKRDKKYRLDQSSF